MNGPLPSALSFLLGPRDPRRLHLVFALVLTSTFVALPTAHGAATNWAGPQLGLTVDEHGDVRRNGQLFRGIGVNFYDAFVSALARPDSNRTQRALHTLASRQIPFARFAACGYWPSEMRLYETNREVYLARLDQVVQAAEREGVGLIPSFFWLTSTVPDLVGEPVRSWGDPTSRTHAFLRRYVAELVQRYRYSPAIWAWEFGNEFNLPADLPNAAEHRPPVVPQLGTPDHRTHADELTHAIIRIALRAFADEVRRYDRDRLILSGNAFPRRSAWHQMTEHNWQADSPSQFDEMLASDNPSPINSLTVRGYEASDWERLGAAQAIARRQRKPLFVGEFGCQGPATAAQREEFARRLATLESLGVSLAALWVYEFGGQDGEWNVTATNERAYQLDAISAANQRLRRSR